jgi:hypothetical protein
MFLVPSGVDEFSHVTEANLREAMPELAARDQFSLFPKSPNRLKTPPRR